MTNANILGGGCAQTEINKNPDFAAYSRRGSGHRDYLDAANNPAFKRQSIAVADLIDPAFIALATFDDVAELLQAAMAIPQDHPSYQQHFRAVVMAAFRCLDFGADAVDSEFEAVFSAVAGVKHD